MAATWTIAGVTLGPNGPVNGAVVNVWKAQRFSTAPAQNAAAPSGSADAGPVTSGTAFGGPGAFQIACPTNESYYVAVTYNTITYWSLVNDLNFTDEVATTVAAGSTGQQIGSLTSSQLHVASTTGLNATGRVNVTASGGQAVLSYTGTSGGNTLTGVAVVSGTGTWTVTTGAAVTQTQQIATLNQVLDDGSGDATFAAQLSANTIPLVGFVAQAIPGATPTINVATTSTANLTGLAVAITGITISGTPVAGQELIINFTDNGTGRAITFGASFEASGTVTLPTTTSAGVMLSCQFQYNPATSKFRIMWKS